MVIGMNRIKAIKVVKLLLFYRCLYLFSCYWQLNEKKNETDSTPAPETESRPKTASGDFSEKCQLASEPEPSQTKHSSKRNTFLNFNFRQGDYMNPVNFVDPMGEMIYREFEYLGVKYEAWVPTPDEIMKGQLYARYVPVDKKGKPILQRLVLFPKKDLYEYDWFEISTHQAEMSILTGLRSEVLNRTFLASLYGFDIVEAFRGQATKLHLKGTLHHLPETLLAAVGSYLMAAEANAAKRLSAIAEIRQSLKIGKGRNIAFADVQIDGKFQRFTGISGKASRPGTVGVPEKRLFKTFEVSGYDRAFDSEVKILEDIASRLSSNSSGTIRLFSERNFCPSCSGVVKQFKKMFPNIKLLIESGGI